MKKTTILAVLLSTVVVGCSRSERYEFHPMQGGVGMWRCDKKTGLVEMTTVQNKAWIPVAESQPNPWKK